MKRLFWSFVAFLMLATAIAAFADVPNVDLSTMPLKELNGLISDIEKAEDLYHNPNSSQKEKVLSVTKEVVIKSLTNATNISWPWFDYSYAKDWDFYTLKTSVDYRIDNEKYSKNIYSEVVCEPIGTFSVYYLVIGNETVIDNRSQIPATYWTKEPDGVINQDTGINLSILTSKELSTFKKEVKGEISANHTTNSSITSMVESLAKNAVEQSFLANGIKVSWPWFDYSYTNDWGLYTIKTSIDYTDANGKSVTKKVYGEAYPTNGIYAMTYLSVGDTVLIDSRSVSSEVPEPVTPETSEEAAAAVAQDSIPVEPEKESAAPHEEKSASVERNNVSEGLNAAPAEPGKENGMSEETTSTIAESEKEFDISEQTDVLPAEQTESQQDIFSEAPEESQIPVESFNGIHLDFKTATDEELAEAIELILSEQRARLVTKVVLDNTEMSVKKGSSVKISASVTDLPEDVQAAQFTWNTSDKAIASCSNGTISGVNPGSAVITCSTTLSDGTEIYENCTVTVYLPITGITAKTPQNTLAVGSSMKPEFTVNPNNATNQILSFVSSDEQIVSVDDSGNVTALGPGTATVTANATDGSEKSAKTTFFIPSFATLTENYTIDTKGAELVKLVKYYGSDPASIKIESPSKCFALLDGEWDEDGIYSVYISPVNAGTGTITFKEGNDGKNIAKITVNIDHNAVYDKTSYPKAVYKDILRNPDNYSGKTFSITGRILQKQESTGWFSDTRILRVATRGRYDDVFYVDYSAADFDENFIEGDQITVYGVCTGAETYSALIGDVTIPSIKAEKIYLGIHK